MLASVMIPLATHAFRDRARHLPTVVGRSLRCFHVLHGFFFATVVISPCCFASYGHHLSRTIAIVFSLLPCVPNSSTSHSSIFLISFRHIPLILVRFTFSHCRFTLSTAVPQGRDKLLATASGRIVTAGRRFVLSRSRQTDICRQNGVSEATNKTGTNEQPATTKQCRGQLSQKKNVTKLRPVPTPRTPLRSTNLAPPLLPQETRNCRTPLQHTAVGATTIFLLPCAKHGDSNKGKPGTHVRTHKLQL